MNDGNCIQLPRLELPNPEKDRGSDGDFMRDLIFVSDQINRLLVTTPHIQPDKNVFPEARPILMGMMARCYKLFDTFLLLVTQNRPECALIMVRCFTDTAIDAVYLIKHGNAEIVNKWMISSLANDKIIWEEIQADIDSGIVHPDIQSRMQDTVLQRFSAAGYQIDDVDSRDWNADKSARKKAELTGMMRQYHFMFRNSSRVVHGRWSDLDTYHLVEKDGQYYPKTTYGIPSPAIIEGVALLALELSSKYIAHIVEKPDPVFHRWINDATKWFHTMANEHEKHIG